jgi:hypothetical protein
MPNDWEVFEVLRRPKLRRNIDATKIPMVVVLLFWIRNKIQEIRDTYFLTDVRLPATPGVRKERDKAPRTRPNPLIEIGGRHVYRVQVVEPGNKWHLHLDDRSIFKLELAPWVKAPKRESYPSEDAFLAAKLAREEMVDLIMSLGFTQSMAPDGRVVTSLGPILKDGIDLGFTRDWMRAYHKDGKRVKWRVHRVWRIVTRLEQKYRLQERVSEPVPTNRAMESHLARLNRLETKRTEWSFNNSEDNSNSMSWLPWGDTEATPWEYRLSSIPFGDPEMRISGAERGKGHVHPAMEVRVGIFDKDPKWNQRLNKPYKERVSRVYTAVPGATVLSMKKVEKTIEIPGTEWKTDWMLEKGNILALINAIRRELIEGRTPFVVHTYQGPGEYMYDDQGKVIGVRRKERGQDWEEISCSVGDTVRLQPCTHRNLRTKRLKCSKPEGWTKNSPEANTCKCDMCKPVSRCGCDEYRIHQAFVECTRCGAQRWRKRIYAYVRLDRFPMQVEDYVGRYLTYERGGMKFFGVALYGPQVEFALHNMKLAGYDPSKISLHEEWVENQDALANESTGSLARKRLNFIALQRFWDDYRPKPLSPLPKPKHKKALKPERWAAPIDPCKEIYPRDYGHSWDY